MRGGLGYYALRGVRTGSTNSLARYYCEFSRRFSGNQYWSTVSSHAAIRVFFFSRGGRKENIPTGCNKEEEEKKKMIISTWANRIVE